MHKIYALKEVILNVPDLVSRCAVLTSSTHSGKMNKTSMLVQVALVLNIQVASSEMIMGFPDTGTVTRLLQSTQLY